MGKLKKNADGTFSIVHTANEVSAAEAANVKTADARQAQAEADAAAAQQRYEDRIARVAESLPADGDQTSDHAS
ncbi:hypothetical protein CIW48_27230 [Methylobacterium sp. P1-11]|uniref:hypothetical protein n=1 Tax=Methylobacterium sp. P1-11 TaxID=2024616 RepID=UPI0011EF0637|nr:hypothetical protein [Methylobacterium sp. P1-11]KAA0117896.1 hypothetical protein CIW48_27230 [Methylobacterium sp. P1-11]